MTRTNDGFEIAEADLQLRGPGDLDGTQQSGLPFQLRIANLAKDGALLQLARNAASEILTKDSMLISPENKLLEKQLEHRRKETANWSVIS